MVEDIITCFPEAVSVLDMSMGSGTTGVACVNKGLHFTGIEKDPIYFQQSEERIAEAKRRIGASSTDIFESE